MNNSGIVNIEDDDATVNNTEVVSETTPVENAAIAGNQGQESVIAQYSNAVGDEAPTLESVAVENADSTNQVVNEEPNVETDQNIPQVEETNNNQTGNGEPPVPPVGNVTNEGNVSSVEPIEFDEVPPSVINYTDETRFESYFDGKMLDYLAYTFLRGFIIGLTAGVGKPWADCIFYEYKYHHTIYNGKRLKFVGKPTELFVERFKWIFFTMITFGIYALWIPLKKQKWIAQNTYFGDEEIIAGESFFDAGLLGLIGVNLLTTVLSVVTFGLLLPFSICYKRRWIAKHTIITRKRIIFKGRALGLFGNLLKWAFLSLITFGIYGLWFPIKKENWFAKNTYIKLKNESY